MAPRTAKRTALLSLMTGAAIASIATAALAEGWSGLIVFGGRDYDSGQYVSHEAVFADSGDTIGDGRYRATNLVAGEDGGGYGLVAPQRVARDLGLAPITPSQPQSYPGVPTPAAGYNYASSFYSSGQILGSIEGTATTNTIDFLGDDETVVRVEGSTGPGLLRDTERGGDAWGALVMVGAATRDLRRTADIVRLANGDIDLNGAVDPDADGDGDGPGDSGRSLNGSFIDLDAASRDFTSTLAAENIAAGVRALAGAEAGLVVVVNSYDVGAIPEVGGDNRLLTDADSQLTDREEEAADSEESARSAELAASNAELTAATSEQARIAAEHQYYAVSSDPDSTSTEVAAASQDRAAATVTANNDRETAQNQRTEADEARREADELALSPQEVALRPQIDAAIADPGLIARNRTEATDIYNAQLVQQLQGVDGNVVLIDQRALFDAVIADPARFGLSADVNQANACLGDDTLYPCNAAGGVEGDLLFASGIELSSAGHQLAADQITALVSAPADLSGIPYVGITAARSITDAARDQLSREQTWKAGVYPFVAGVGSGAQLTESNGFQRHDSRHYSGVLGMKYVTGNGVAVGAAGSYQSIGSPGDGSAVDYDGSGWFGTVFTGINTGPIFGKLTGTYGKVDYGDAARITQIGSARIRNEGDAKGTVAGVTAEAGLRLVEYDILRAGPVVNFSHWRSTVDGYSESGWEATAVSTGDIEARSTRAGIGVFMEAGNLIDGQGSLFRMKALYGHEFEDATRTASVTPLGENSAGSFSTRVRGADKAPLEFGAEIVLGFRGMLTTFGYDGLVGDVSDHRFRVGASLPL